MRQLALALVFCACTKPAPTGAPSPDASAPVVASASASAAPPVVTCSFENGFHGTMAPDLEIFARLERTGDALKGHYFYSKVGTDLALTGAITGDKIHLSEGATGEFDGTCAPDGHLHGHWHKPGADADKRAFDLEPIGPRDIVVVATRQKVKKFPPKPAKGAPMGMFQFEKNEMCQDSVAWPEVFGAGSPAIEAALNAKLVNSKFLLGKGDEQQMKECVTGERVKGARTFDVLMNEAGILAMRSHETFNYEGGTHPWDPGAEQWMTFDTKTGAKIDRKAMFDESKPAFGKLFAEVAQKCAEGDDKLTLANKELLMAPTPKGLEIAATGYPPAARVLEGNGPTIAWSAVVATGALRDTVVSRYAQKQPVETAKCTKRD